MVAAFAANLDRVDEDPALAARALSLPGSGYLGQQMAVIDVEGIRHAIDHVRDQLGTVLRDRWLAAYRAHVDEGPLARDRRHGTALAQEPGAGVPAHAGDAEARDLVRTQYANADNMTDSLSALRLIAEIGMADRDAALAAFYERWRHEPLVVNKWFSLQAGIEDEGAVERVESLLAHPAFTWSNPNRVRAVLGAFAMVNLVGFHRPDGAGYRLLADRVLSSTASTPRSPRACSPRSAAGAASTRAGRP